MRNTPSTSIRYTLHQIPDYKAHQPWQSLIGGLPSFPPGVAWPLDDVGNPLAFVAQLNMAEVKPFDKEELLPASGFLYFFYEADQMMSGYNPEEKELFKVMWVDCGPEELVRAKNYPEGIRDMSKFWPSHLSYNDGEGMHKSFGSADNMQEKMEPFCETHFGGDDWVLLLQVDSNDEAYMYWAAEGRLYFWIRREDLKNRNFEHCWCFLQY